MLCAGKNNIIKILKLFSGVCGTVAVVDGTYAYHHYMQDNFNDDVSIHQSGMIC